MTVDISQSISTKVRCWAGIELMTTESAIGLATDCAIGPGTYGPRCEKTCLRWFANNKGADQPAHPRSLISASVIRFLKSIISRLATSEISIF